MVATLCHATVLRAQDDGGLFVGPPGIEPLSVRNTVPGYDLGLSDSIRHKPHRTSFIAAPIPFYNAQVGAGLVGVIGGIRRLGANEDTPPSFGGLIGMATTNGSWGAGLGAQMHTSGDAWRLLGGGMYVDVRYKFYGIGRESDVGVGLRQKMLPVRVQALRRIARHVYFGLRGQYSSVSIATDFDSVPPPFVPFERDPKKFTEVLLAPVLDFDSRDDEMWPTRGWYVDAAASFFSSAFGSDSTMQNYTTLVTWQHGWDNKSQVIAASTQGCYSTGEVPITQLCTVGGMNGLRGHETGKYMDRTQLTVQAEYRKMVGRFGFTAFAGAAQIAPTPGKLSTDDLLYAGGIGLRFRMLKKFPINYRVDFAFGRDGIQYYFSLGEAF